MCTEVVPGSDLGSWRRFEGWGGGEAKMSVNTVPASASHGNLDEQIAQLMQCKPLLEQEVLSLSLSLSLSVYTLISVFFGGGDEELEKIGEKKEQLEGERSRRAGRKRKRREKGEWEWKEEKRKGGEKRRGGRREAKKENEKR
ncbi:hypothetical protein GW17_00010281 [Ensete ventricosum]|nr:hypothetical protein GW17_00010281 [Ensete ventricosum]